MDPSEKKRNAAKASLEFIEPGTVVGIGTGSTVNELIKLLTNRQGRFELQGIEHLARGTRLQSFDP
jgi:ribose 5-phosphate isomerase A